jgi:hypothetical protein
VIQVGERKMRGHLREVVRRTMEKALNAFLDVEDRRAKAERGAEGRGESARAEGEGPIE